jgi:hypothetical protein
MFQPAFITAQGQRVLRLDFQGLTCAELETALHVAGRLIAGEPPASVRILTVFDSRFDGQTAEALKRYVIGNGPYVLASAVIARGFWRAVFTSLKLGVRPDLQFFDDEEQALRWLCARRAPGAEPSAPCGISKVRSP